MDAQSVRPLAVGHGSQGDAGGFTFLLPGRETKVEGADEVLPALLLQCNGLNPVEEIALSVSILTEYEVEEIDRLIAVLFEQGILVDAREYYEVFHGISANPMLYYRDVSEEDLARALRGKSHLAQPQHVSGPRTQLERLLELRASTREFSGEPFSREEFLRLAWAVYGKIERSKGFPSSTIGVGTVPSGGALYPLRLYGITLNVASLEENGVYEVGSQGIVCLRSIEPNELARIFSARPTFEIERAALVLVLACDFKQTTQKYSNRGYRYALLEAGHAAQNAYLWCAEQGLGVVEVGGFNDGELARTLQLSYPQQAPLIALIVGRKNP